VCTLRTSKQCIYSLWNPFHFYFKSITSDKLIILGDFNVPDIDWDSLSGHSPISNQFCDLVFESSLCQLIDTPTHNHGNILDLVLTNLDDNISCTFNFSLACHLIILTLPFHCLHHFQYPPSKPLLILHLIYSKGNYQGADFTLVMMLSIYGVSLSISWQQPYICLFL